jgi:membrane protease YdiL (CAAX protease family)
MEGERSSRMSVVRRYPLIVFFVLAYVFSWWPWPLYAFGLSPSPIIAFGPFLAAILVLALTTGKGGVVTLLRRMVRWRVRPVWYAVALLLPVAISGGAALLNVVVLGASAPSPAELGAWSGLVPIFFLQLLVPGIGGAWEEPGWRGYALPKLQGGHSALLASLILGVVWAFWHLPLMVIGQIHLSDPVYIVAWTVVLTWVFNNTNGSVLIAMLMHNMHNVISGGYFSAMFSGADWVRQGWLLVALWCAVAAIVVVVNGPEHLSRKYTRQTLTPPEASAPTPRVV